MRLKSPWMRSVKPFLLGDPVNWLSVLAGISCSEKFSVKAFDFSALLMRAKPDQFQEGCLIKVKVDLKAHPDKLTSSFAA